MCVNRLIYVSKKPNTYGVKKRQIYDIFGCITTVLCMITIGEKICRLNSKLHRLIYAVKCPNINGNFYVSHKKIICLTYTKKTNTI